MEASALQAPSVGIARLTLAPRLLRLRSDEQLVSLFRAGSEDAFGVIHDRYRQRLFAYCRQMLASRPDAEDALQDVFIRAYSALRASDRPIALRAWLYRVAHNRCVDHLRRPLPPAAEILEMSKGPMPDPMAEAERREDLKRLVADMRRLPTQQRSVLLMRELEGLSYADLAATLDVTVPAVKSLLVRARMGLVEAAEARDTACSDIRQDLALAHGRGVRANSRARRHLRDCPGCRAYRQDMRRVQRSLAALTPTGPLVFLAKLTGLGGSGGGGSGAAAGGAASTGAGGLAGGGAATTGGLAGGGVAAGTGVAGGGVAAGAGSGVATASGVAAGAGSGIAAGGGAAGGGLATASGLAAGSGIAAGGGAAAGGGLVAAGSGAAALTAGKVAAVVSAVVVAGSGAAAVEQNLTNQTTSPSAEPTAVQIAPVPLRPEAPVPLVKPKAADQAATTAGAPAAPVDTTSHTPLSSSGAGSSPSDSSSAPSSGGLAAPGDSTDGGGGATSGDKTPAPRSQSGPSSSTPSLATPHSGDGSTTAPPTTSGGAGSGAATPKP